MKCPECDSIQPDNAALCSKCGLSFAAWNSINQEPSAKKPEPEKEMTFPVPEEDEPEPEEEPISKPIESSREKKDEPEAKKEKKSVKNKQKTLLVGAAAGIVLIVLAFLIFGRKPAQTIPPIVEPTPTAQVLSTQINLTVLPTSVPAADTPTALPTATPTHEKPPKTPTPIPQAAAVEPPTAAPNAVSSTPDQKTSSEKPAVPADAKDEAVTLEVSGDEETPTPSSSSAASQTAAPIMADPTEAPKK